MLNEKVVKLLNEQVNKEFFSAYLYLDMANYYVNEGLDGFANWFMIQAQEEKDHALLFMKYLQNNNVNVVLEAIDKPNISFKDFKTPLTEALKHEQFVTASINAIYDEAVKVKDFRTQEFLTWFVKEQGEEELNATTNITKYDLFATTPQGLYQLDQEFLQRKYVAPDLVLE